MWQKQNLFHNTPQFQLGTAEWPCSKDSTLPVLVSNVAFHSHIIYQLNGFICITFQESASLSKFGNYTTKLSFLASHLAASAIRRGSNAEILCQ